MKYKVTAHLDFTEDVLELDDDLTEEEVEKNYTNMYVAFSIGTIEKLKKSNRGAKANDITRI